MTMAGALVALLVAALVAEVGSSAAVAAAALRPPPRDSPAAFASRKDIAPAASSSAAGTSFRARREALDNKNNHDRTPSWICLARPSPSQASDALANTPLACGITVSEDFAVYGLREGSPQDWEEYSEEAVGLLRFETCTDGLSIKLVREGAHDAELSPVAVPAGRAGLLRQAREQPMRLRGGQGPELYGQIVHMRAFPGLESVVYVYFVAVHARHASSPAP